jgi:hypothetical protein
LETIPDTFPDPYWISYLVPLFLKVEECLLLYVLWVQQAGDQQEWLGTHRLDDPVSKITLKGWPGVPMEISP